MFLRGLYKLNTYDIPVPGPHIGSEKTPKTEKNLYGVKREETFRRATEENPSPGWTEAIDVTTHTVIDITKKKRIKCVEMNSVTELQHIQ